MAAERKKSSVLYTCTYIHIYQRDGRQFPRRLPQSLSLTDGAAYVCVANADSIYIVLYCNYTHHQQQPVPLALSLTSRTSPSPYHRLAFNFPPRRRTHHNKIRKIAVRQRGDISRLGHRDRAIILRRIDYVMRFTDRFSRHITRAALFFLFFFSFSSSTQHVIWRYIYAGVTSAVQHIRLLCEVGSI